jgi:hypothetical protein
MERHGIPMDKEASAVLSAFEPQLADYVYCWEFHKRNENHPAIEGKECEDCLVFNTKTKDCFVLRKEAEPGQILCGGPCDECDYYRYVTEMDMPASGPEG